MAELERYLRAQRHIDAQIKKLLAAASLSAGTAANRLKTDPTATREVQNEINRVIRTLFRKISPLLHEGQAIAAEAAARATLDADAEILESLIPDVKMRRDWEARYIAQARQFAPNLMRGRDDRTLAARVAGSGTKAQRAAQRYIQTQFKRNLSHRQTVAAIRKLFNPQVPGGVSYAAVRLSRTEIANAFQAQSELGAQERPWVESVTWNLSGLHKPDPNDLCDLYARQGTFPKDRVPKRPHPNCMCYLTYNIVSQRQFALNLEFGLYDDIFGAETGYA